MNRELKVEVLLGPQHIRRVGYYFDPSHGKDYSPSGWIVLEQALSIPSLWYSGLQQKLGEGKQVYDPNTGLPGTVWSKT